MSRGLSPTNKDSTIILSENNTVAASSSPTGDGRILSVRAHSSGKRYFEIVVAQYFSGDKFLGAGITSDTGSLTITAGSLPVDYTAWVISADATQVCWQNNGTNIALVNGAMPSNSSHSRFLIAADITAGKAWIGIPSRNGHTWTGGAAAENISPLMSSAATFSIGAGTYYAALSPRRGHASDDADRNKLRFVSTFSGLSYFSQAFIDAGYLPWDTNPASVSVTARDESGGLLASTEFNWAFFEDTTADALARPVATGTATTNGSGVMSVSIPATSLLDGETGSLLISTTDGTAGAQCRSWYMPVTVTV